MSYLSTLLVDGHDLRAQTGIKIVGDMELFAPGDRRGEHDTIPGQRGLIGAPLPIAAYVFSVSIQVLGASRGERNDNLLALGAILAGTNGLVALTRRLATGSGSSYTESTASGQFVSGLSMQLMNDKTGRTELQFYNLSGAWWNGTAWTIP